MENIDMKVVDGKIVITVDPSVRLGLSVSKNTVLVASSQGIAQTPVPGLKLSMTVFTKEGIEKFR